MKIPEKVPEMGFYYHYKHDPNKSVNNYAYEFLGLGFHTEEDSCFASYRPLYEDASVHKASIILSIPCTDERPLIMWMENVTKEGKTFPRFKKITDPDIIAKLEKIRDEMYKTL